MLQKVGMDPWPWNAPLCVSPLTFNTCLLSNLHQLLSFLNTLLCFSHFVIYWGKKQSKGCDFPCLSASLCSANRE